MIVRLEIEHTETVDPDNVIQEANYEFSICTDDTDGTKIVSTEIVEVRSTLT